MDLATIGYTVTVSSVFDEITTLVVDRFQRRFFAGSRVRPAHAPRQVGTRFVPPPLDGVVDRETALAIKEVRRDFP
jgi:hypothetical protein